MTASARHTASYYAASSLPQPDYPALAGETVADVCVIGGGFSGLNTALELAERGFSVVLLEARKIAWGASGRNGGQLIRGVGHGLEQFTNVIGTDGVRQMKLMGLEAVEIVRERVERFQIACDLTWGYCDLANKPRDLLGLAEDAEELRSLGYRHEVRLLQASEMGSVIGSERYVGGMIDMGSGHLHPLNLALGEAAAAQKLGVQDQGRPVEGLFLAGVGGTISSEKAKLRTLTFDEISLAGGSYPKAEVDVSPGLPRIGSFFLKDYRVTFDFRRKRLWLEW